MRVKLLHFLPRPCRSNLAASIRYSSNISRSPAAESQPQKFVPRRALLYVPGSSEKMLQKAADLQDGVALTAKATARENVRKYLDDKSTQKHRCHELGIRVNSVSSQMLEDDLKVLAQAKHQPQAFMIPKVDSVEDLATIWNLFRTHYGADRITNTETRLVIWIESARALLDMPRILNAALNMHRSAKFFRLDAVVFGSDDFCADIGAIRSLEGTENLYARQFFVTCCKAFGLQAIDSVNIDIKNLDGLREQCLQGRSWGFTGKQTIHPSQVPVVQSAFLPSSEQCEWAQQLIAEFADHNKSGKGAFIFRGQMIDRPLLRQAINIAELIKQVGNDHTDKTVHK